MDFDDSPEEAAFRQECRTWLAANAKLRTPGIAEVWRTLRPRDEGEDDASLLVGKRWQALKADAGFAGIQWPVEYGGRGLSGHLAGVFKQEEARYDVPANSFQVGVDMVGPTLIAHGTPAQCQRHLDPIKRGDEVWCQLFSEPDAGSDLAGLSTRAVRDGDEFVVNGQKVWTSGAQSSDWGILLVRTDPDQPKHRGITYLLVDMRTPGIEVRPLTQIDGAVHFNEVFLSDVRVPVENVVGEIDGGWGVTMTTLVNERSAIGGGGMVQFAEILMLAQELGRTDEPVLRQELAKIYTYFQITRFLGYRVQTSISNGRQPGPESSVMKLHISRQYGEGGDLYMSLLGAAGMLWLDDAPFDGFFQGLFLAQWAPRIGGGTDQIQRNIAGERVLGLPAEPRVDKAVPFKDL
ncbi:MAG TPA: acyl-CoA dehydrogenase family protein [Microthrixaceae bacterium]|jgi:alkylation response protein AidB-like acyl-CoA dehydrogenase|nr:acyl-CoA dehydrogenase family protein [Microthrixaceae bacterium]